jgi:2-amino-4-hydroxy-6-hydroxymethyldihydropteridine diphosphokinase
VAIAIGSNLGDRHAAIAFAAERLSSFIGNPSLSTLIETEAEGVPVGTQPMYLNAVLAGETGLPARQLLDSLLAIEREYGRERPYQGAPRTLDLDLVLLGDEVVNEPGLHVPHPRFRERFFVLGPLAEVASDLRDPVTGMSVSQLLQRLLKDESR